MSNDTDKVYECLDSIDSVSLSEAFNILNSIYNKTSLTPDFLVGGLTLIHLLTESEEAKRDMLEAIVSIQTLKGRDRLLEVNKESNTIYSVCGVTEEDLLPVVEKLKNLMSDTGSTTGGTPDA